MVDKSILTNENTRIGTGAVSAVGALNWGVVEFAETDLLIDVIGLSGDSLTLGYGVMTASAAVFLYNLATDLMED